jgi:hypothetical protein
LFVQTEEEGKRCSGMYFGTFLACWASFCRKFANLRVYLKLEAMRSGWIEQELLWGDGHIVGGEAAV